MKILNCLALVLIGILLASCSCQDQPETVNKPVAEDELLRFAEANCFYRYFKNNNYDLKDIGAISGGIVETGSYSAEKYQKVSELVKDYAPEIRTKQEIDVELLKCFELEKDETFLSSLEEIRQAPAGEED